MQPGATKICPQCRQPVPLDAPFCAQCGHAFRTQFAQPGPQYPQAQYPPGQYPQNPQPQYQQPQYPQQFPPGQYPPPNVVYVPMPPQHRVSGAQTALKWLLGLLVFACMGVGVYLMFKMKSAAATPPVRPAPSAVAPGQGVPTNMFNDEAANSPYRISIHWLHATADTVEAQVENESAQDLPNLSIQVMTADANGHDQWSDPYSISYLSEDGLPAGKGGTLDLPYGFSAIERLHAYYVQNSPAGAVQHEVAVDQTSDLPK